MTEPDFLELEEVLELHERQIEAFGGTLGIRDQGLLESALAMPGATFGGQFVHESLFAMAAAYAFHIAQNQPFLDGKPAALEGGPVAYLPRRRGGAVVQNANSSWWQAPSRSSARSWTKRWASPMAWL